ncbi:MAG: sugar phosphate isomerase/epimerase [Anaerolineaceae bacterium]|nr:sugar phosphate isomerase/epimerase [Anaerolineaceae bacterium]
MLFAGQLEEGLRETAENGFDVVELSLRNPSDLPAKEIAALLAKYGLKLSAIATGQSCLHDGMCLAAADEDGVEGAVARLKAFINIAEDLNAAVILGGIRGRFTGSPEEMAEQRKRAAEAIAACAEVATPKGVQLLIEPINRYETNFINTAEEGVQFAEEIGHPEIKLLLDTFHMNIEETDPDLTLTRFREQLGYVHFADSNRQAPGMGHLPFRQYLSTLIKNHYQGVVTAEILPLPDDEDAMAQAGAFVKSLTSTVQSGS